MLLRFTAVPALALVLLPIASLRAQDRPYIESNIADAADSGETGCGGNTKQGTGTTIGFAAARPTAGTFVNTEQGYMISYELQIPGMPGQPFVLRRDGNKLKMITDEGDERELLPETETTFFHADTEGVLDFVFRRDAEGRVEGLTMIPVGLGREYQARKLE